MKTTITIIIGLLISLSVWAKSNEMSTAYFICHFEKVVSEKDMEQLKSQGFEIFQINSKDHIVYVKPQSNSIFSKELKSNMTQLISVDKNGNRTYLIESITNESPEFIKLFFNFI